MVKVCPRCGHSNAADSEAHFHLPGNNYDLKGTTWKFVCFACMKEYDHTDSREIKGLYVQT